MKKDKMDLVDFTCCFVSLVCLILGISARSIGDHTHWVVLFFSVSALYAIPSIKWIFGNMKFIFEQMIKRIKGDGDNEKR